MNEMEPKAQGERTGGNISKPEVILKLRHFLQTLGITLWNNVEAFCGRFKKLY